MSDPKRSDLNPKTTSYEFLGPPGAFAITIGVPVLTYVLFFTCNESSDGCPPPLQTLYPSLVQAVTDPEFWWKLWDPEAFAIYYSWYAFCLVTWAILPGDWVQGTQLRDGKYQQYKINGTIFASTTHCLTHAGVSHQRSRHVLWPLASRLVTYCALESGHSRSFMTTGWDL